MSQAVSGRTILLTEEEDDLPPPRRGVLRTLITAPLAALATHKLILGTAPTPAPAATREMLLAYEEWLFFERRLLLEEMYSDPDERRLKELISPVNQHKAVDRFFFNGLPAWNERPQPSTRAARVLGTVGIDWTAA